MKIKEIVAGFGLLAVLATSCTKNPDSPGVEYMPDMYRSPAVEAYVDYGLVGDQEHVEFMSEMSARQPVAGTIPFNGDPSKAQFNFPFPFPEGPQGYAEAGAAITSNPVPYSAEAVEEGKVIYDKFCTHCHGSAGAGNGAVVEKGGFPSPGDYKTKDITEGHMYHTIFWGKGMMGQHASQLDGEERWKVIHYIQELRGLNEDKKKAPEAPTEVAEITAAEVNPGHGDADHH